ncbi:MAG: hypothetical protein QGG40_04905, partial [Myxococcota bacterium]|nr:hypothetical protein [Myxococcota bacterium]
SVLLLGGHNDCDYRSQRLDQGGSTLARQVVGEPSPYLQTTQSRFPLRDLLRNSRTYRLSTQVMVQLQDRRGLTDSCAPSIKEGLATARVQASGSGYGLAIATYPLPLRWARGDQAGPAAVSWSLNQLLRAEAANLGLPLVDLAKCVQGRQAEATEVFFTEDDLHMTRHGHDATAKCLASSMDLVVWPGETSEP